MLDFELTPNHAGIVLWGDYESLRRLNTFINHVVQESIIVPDKEGFVLRLAYDVRKAHDGQRKEGYRNNLNESDRCRVYGVEVLWPLLLVQVGILRQAMSYIPTNKLHQAYMFEMEHLVESALRVAIPNSADAIIEQVSAIGATNYNHLSNVIDSRCRYFIGLPAMQRLNALLPLMQSLNPMHESYYETQNQSGLVNPLSIPPDAFETDGHEWPAIEW